MDAATKHTNNSHPNTHTQCWKNHTSTKMLQAQIQAPKLSKLTSEFAQMCICNCATCPETLHYYKQEKIKTQEQVLRAKRYLLLKLQGQKMENRQIKIVIIIQKCFYQLFQKKKIKQNQHLKNIQDLSWGCQIA